VAIASGHVRWAAACRLLDRLFAGEGLRCWWRCGRWLELPLPGKTYSSPESAVSGTGAGADCSPVIAAYHSADQDKPYPAQGRPQPSIGAVLTGRGAMTAELDGCGARWGGVDRINTADLTNSTDWPTQLMASFWRAACARGSLLREDIGMHAVGISTRCWRRAMQVLVGRP